jgi:hypothetical protein
VVAAWDAVRLAGLALMAIGAATGAVALLAVVPRAFRVRRRGLALQSLIASARADLDTALDELAARRAEGAALLTPWRAIWRWARHPLVVATLDWWRRRGPRG